MVSCPECESEKTRRGGTLIWIVYLALIAFALVAVLGFQLHSGLVAGVVLAAIIIIHIVIGQRICLDCGHQWRG